MYDFTQKIDLRGKVKNFFILLVFLFTQNFLYSQTVYLDPKISKLDNFEIYYIKDIDNSLNYENIKNIDFKEKITNQFTFGYVNYPIWFKLDLKNSSNEANSFILALEKPSFDNVTLMYEKNGTVYKVQNSVKDDIMQRELPHANSHFKLHLEANESLSVYLKVQSLFSIFAEVYIYNEKYYNHNSTQQYFIYFFYLGAVGVMAFYNLFLYLYLKEVSYLYYFGYSFNFGFWVGLFSGALYYYIPIKYIYYLHICVPLSLVFLILFSNRVLNIKSSYPIIYKISNLTLLFLFVLVFWVLLDIEMGFTLLNIISPYIFFTYLILSFMLILKKSAIAKYYFIAMGIYLITMTLLILMITGVLPNNIYLRYLFLAGSFIELVMLSLILGFRINLMQKEYQNRLEDEIEKQTKNINKQNKILKNLLKEKEELLKEIFHRIKNNFQILIAMLSIEISKESSNYTKNKIENIILKLKSMSIVYDMLYNQKDNEIISIKEFFSKLCHHLSLPNIKINASIDEFLLDSKITKDLGLLINELITNSIKHSNYKEICVITLSISKKDNIVIIEYKDDGNSIKNSNYKQGYGTMFIEEFRSKLNNCIVKLENSFQYYISFEL